MSKYPRILDFLEAHHPDLYSIFDDLALSSSLTPKRGASGITFLLPDASLVKELRKQTDGDDPEVATDILFSLIIPVFLPDAKSWQEVKDDVPNLLNKKVEVSNVGASEIKLKSGSLTLNKKFKPFSRSGTSNRGNMAVWDLKGTVEYKSAPESDRKYTKKGGAPKKKKRSYRGGSSDPDSRIRQFVKNVEALERDAMRNTKAGETCDSVKLRVVANYHKYLVDRAEKGDSIASDHLDYFEHLCELNCSGGVESAFYLTFACRDSENREGLNNSMFLAETLSSLLVPCDKPVAYLTKAMNEATKKRLDRVVGGSDGFDVKVVIDNISWGVRASSAKELVSFYNEYTNKMDNSPTKDRYRSVSNLKLLIDEFKFHCVHAWLETMRKGPDSKDGDHLKNYNDFQACLNKFKGMGDDIIINNPNAQSCILNWSVNPSDARSEGIRYMKDFMTEKDGMCRDVKKTISGGDDSDDEDIRYLDANHDYSDSKAEGLSEAALAELRNYKAAHGKLPDL